MKRARFLMLLLITFLVALPVAAGTLSVSNDLLTVEFSETKIFTGEELTVMSYSENVAAPAVISIQSCEITNYITIVNTGFQVENYNHTNYIGYYEYQLGGVPLFAGCN